MTVLDKVPLATIIALVSIVIIVVAYLSDDMNIQDSLVALGAVLGGSGVIGIARAQSGKGIASPPQG